MRGSQFRVVEVINWYFDRMCTLLSAFVSNRRTPNSPTARKTLCQDICNFNVSVIVNEKKERKKKKRRKREKNACVKRIIFGASYSQKKIHMPKVQEYSSYLIQERVEHVVNEGDEL